MNMPPQSRNEPVMTCKEALQLLLDQVDFTAGACSLTDMVGQCVPQGVFEKCRAAIAADSEKQATNAAGGKAWSEMSHLEREAYNAGGCGVYAASSAKLPTEVREVLHRARVYVETCNIQRASEKTTQLIAQIDRLLGVTDSR